MISPTAEVVAVMTSAGPSSESINALISNRYPVPGLNPPTLCEVEPPPTLLIPSRLEPNRWRISYSVMCPAPNCGGLQRTTTERMSGTLDNELTGPGAVEQLLISRLFDRDDIILTSCYHSNLMLAELPHPLMVASGNFNGIFHI